MPGAISAVIVATAGPFRRALESHLCPPAFRVVASKASVSDISPGELPQSACLFVIECGEGPAPLMGQIAQLKRQNPLARVVLVGRHFVPADIATAFEAGVNAYFADAIISTELLQAINLITR
jgi:DNA-binding NarL/FixJ family response regulator